MAEQKYQNREIDHFIRDIRETLQKQNETLARIEIQTIRTNGRVASLEWWRSAIAWGLGTFITVAIFLLNYFK